MAIAIVEELWTRIRAAIDDKIVAATTASESAVAAKNAAEAAAIEVQGTVANAATVAAASIVAEMQDLTGRAETAATTATTAVAAEVEKLKGAAPEAFDTLGEIAAELAANETERSALTNSIAAKADADHVHTSEDITDAGVALVAGQLVQREADSSNIRVSETPVATYHATSKYYVDGELTKKANTGDVPVTDGGYGTHHVSDPAADYPKGVSYGLHNATDESWSAAIQADTGYAYSSTFVMVLTLRQSGYTMSTTQMVFSYNNLHNPVFMRKWHDGAWGPFRRLTDDGHTHTSANITDARTWTGRSTDSNAVVMTDAGGWFYVGSNPTHGSHPANKAYVDGKVAGHTLTNSQLPVTELIPGGANLNNYLTTGSYVQNVNANAESGSNYPPNGTRAGLLEVTVGSTFVYQRYTEYTKGRVFSRAKYSSTWCAWAELLDASEATATGRSVLTAADAAAARTAIGAGTSSLTLGTSAGSAARGNHTHSEYAEASRVTALEGSQPIIVSALPASPLAGRIYLVTG